MNHPPLQPHPHPQRERTEWYSLDGPWDFRIGSPSDTDPERVSFDRTVQVPFSPETKASGIADTGLYSTLWYKTSFHPPQLGERRLLLHFEAVDYIATVWVNGQEVLGIYGDRQTVIDDGVSKRLTLKKGPNIVRCAVVNGSGATDFCARFLDQNDKPIKNLAVTLSATTQP